MNLDGLIARLDAVRPGGVAATMLDVRKVFNEDRRTAQDIVTLNLLVGRLAALVNKYLQSEQEVNVEMFQKWIGAERVFDAEAIWVATVYNSSGNNSLLDLAVEAAERVFGVNCAAGLEPFVVIQGDRAGELYFHVTKLSSDVESSDEPIRRLTALAGALSRDVMDYREALKDQAQYRTKKSGDVVRSIRERARHHLIALVVCAFQHTSTGERPVVKLETFLRGAVLSERITTGRSDRLLDKARELSPWGKNLTWVTDGITEAFSGYGFRTPLVAQIVTINSEQTIQLV